MQLFLTLKRITIRVNRIVGQGPRVRSNSKLSERFNFEF